AGQAWGSFINAVEEGTHRCGRTRVDEILHTLALSLLREEYRHTGVVFEHLHWRISPTKGDVDDCVASAKRGLHFLELQHIARHRSDSGLAAQRWNSVGRPRV